jgi:DivIVA domain-containing protein
MAAITGAELRAVTLGRPPIGRRGHRPEEVDDFLARAAEALDARAAGRVPAMGPDEAHAVVFTKPGCRAGRGYDEDQVDDLLDAVAAALSGTATRGIELNGRPLQP